MNMKRIIPFICIVLSLCCNAQQIQTYKGEYPDRFQRVYMLDLTSTYDYYEDDDLSRVYHGPFSLKFKAESKRGQNRTGSIKGQFNHGYYDGDWTFVYPYMVGGYSNKSGYYSTPYTATLKCKFENGEITGPLEVVVTNSANTVVAKTTIQYVNGKREGEISHFSKMKYPTFKNVQGQYKNDKRIGKWTYTWANDDKGVATYDDNGDEDSNYKINSQSGEKGYGKTINLYDLDYSSGLSISVLLNVLYDISVDESKKFDVFWEY